MEYELKKNLIGKYLLKFKCPNCSAGLSAPLEQAGSEDHCPDCQSQFVIPAKDKLEQWRNQKLEQARKAKEAADTAEAQRLIDKQEKERIDSERRLAIEREHLENQEKQQLYAEQQQQVSAAQAALSDQASRLQPSNMRYPVLHAYVPRLKLLGRVLYISGFCVAILGTLFFIRNESMAGIMGSFGFGFSMMAIGGSWMITAELLKVLMDIEENTRRIP